MSTPPLEKCRESQGKSHQQPGANVQQRLLCYSKKLSNFPFPLRLPMCVCVHFDTCTPRHPLTFRIAMHTQVLFFCFFFQPSWKKKCLFLQPKTPKKVKTNSEIPNSKPTGATTTTRRDSVGMANRLEAPLWRHPIAAALPSVVCIDFCFFLDFLVKRTDASSLSFVFFPLSKWAYIIYSKMFWATDDLWMDLVLSYRLFHFGRSVR